MKRINIAYDDILIYKQDGKSHIPNSNLREYDIHPEHVIIGDKLYSFANELGIDFPYTETGKESVEFSNKLMQLRSYDFGLAVFSGRFEYTNHHIDSIYNSDELFIYPIITYDNQLFKKYDTIELNPKLIHAIKKGIAKICFMQHTEGFFGMDKSEIIWMYNLSKRYNLNKEKLFFITSNLKAIQVYDELLKNKEIEDNFTIISYPYFQYNLWFEPLGILYRKEVVDFILEAKFNKFLENNRREKKKYHFLCFNRRVKPHRIAIFTQIISDKKLMSKSIVSMGRSDNNSDDFLESMNRWILDDYKFSKENIINYLSNYDSTQHYTYDYDDLENNKAESLNIEAHTSSFLNIITESLFENNSVFFSEKTYKPIYTLQPFILFGNTGSLRELKRLGFKTFSNWWDESYDDEVDFTRKLEKITELLYTISNWSIDELYVKTQEMEEVLIHNFNTLIDHNYFNQCFDQLIN